MSLLLDELPDGDPVKEGMRERVGLGKRVLETCAKEDVETDMKTVALQCLRAGERFKVGGKK